MRRPLWRHAVQLATAFVTFLLMLSASAQAQSSLSTPSSYWVDDSRQAGLDEAMHATYQPYEHLLALGFHPEPVWIKLTLPPKQPQGGDTYVLRVRPAYLDRLTLHDPQTGLVRESGDQLPPTADEMNSPIPSFEVPALAQARDVYLRVQTTSTRLIKVEVMTPAQARQQDIEQTLFSGFVISISLVFGVGATVLWWYLRETVLGWYALSQNLGTLFMLLATGLARMLVGAWLPPGWLDVLTSVVVILMTHTTLWFVCTFLQEYRPPQTLLRLGFTTAALGFGLLLLGLSGQWGWMLRINTTLAALATCLPIPLLFFAMPDTQSAALVSRKLLLFYVPYLLLVNSNHLTLLGWSAPRDIVLYTTNIHVLFHGLVISSILLLRAKTITEMNRNIRAQLIHEQQQRQIEQQHSQEQEKLFTMLAHELKTPLATLRMWLDAGRDRSDAIERTIADMNQIIERCVQTGQLADQKLVPQLNDVDLTEATQTAIGLCKAPERLSLTCPAQPPKVHADTQILSIVLANLLDNACKYSAAQTPIHIWIEPARVQEKDGWQWQIANTPGLAGLPADHLVFEKYYRSAQAQRQSGSGLGLFLVKGLLTLLGGTIHYAPTLGQVVFTVWLPAARKR